MDNDAHHNDADEVHEETIPLSSETKNCYVFEPEEGSALVSKLYVRKSVFTGKPSGISIVIYED